MKSGEGLTIIAGCRLLGDENMNRFTQPPDYLSTITEIGDFWVYSTCNTYVSVWVISLCLCVALRRLHPPLFTDS